MSFGPRTKQVMGHHKAAPAWTTSPQPTHPLQPPPLPGKSLQFDPSSLSHSLSHAASFFGENHLEVPTATALTDVDLWLQFSTFQPEALLLLAAGQADHLLLQLHSGYLEVSAVSLLASCSSPRWTPASWVALYDSP